MYVYNVIVIVIVFYFYVREIVHFGGLRIRKFRNFLRKTQNPLSVSKRYTKH